MFQDATLLPWRNVQPNVELLAELDGKAKAERRGADRPSTWSAWRVRGQVPAPAVRRHEDARSLARSLVLEPKVFLFDEPFGALDEITRERLNDELLKLFLRAGFAALFITHSIDEAVFLSTRVLVMSARPGRIVGDFPCRSSTPAPRAPLRARLRRAVRRGVPRLRGAHV